MNSIWKYWQRLNIKSTELIGVAVGAFIYSMTYNYLLLPSHLGEGGAMGITALLYYAFGVPSYLSNLLINAVLIVVGYKLFEKKDDLFDNLGNCLDDGFSENSGILYLSHS